MKLHVYHDDPKKLHVKHEGGEVYRRFEKVHPINSSERRSRGELNYVMKHSKSILLKDKKK